MIFKNVVVNHIRAAKIGKIYRRFAPIQLFFQNTAFFFAGSTFIVTFATRNKEFTDFDNKHKR
jgi:hypothetical protein